MNDLQKRTWAEIHLGRLADNYHALRALAPESKFVGLVKANAYGHGAVPVAQKLMELGTDYLAVACLDEALELRRAGIETPVLILGNTPPEYTRELIDAHITQNVYDPALAKEFSRRALELGGKLLCHLKVDTGMSRLGILCDEADMAVGVDALEEMAKLPGLDCEGIFMHFADADSCPEYSEMQIRRFHQVLRELKNRGVDDVFFLICDGLKGLPDAVGAVWPLAIVQTCVVHLLRNTFRYASKKDWDAIKRDVKPIYTAPSAAAAAAARDAMLDKWEARYPAIRRLWMDAWERFIPFLDYDVEIRRVICTTNAIESLNARFKRSIRARGHFPDEQAALKCMYLTVRSLDPTGKGRIRWSARWKPVLNAFAITFADRWPSEGTQQ